jgi:hypothetical protein
MTTAFSMEPRERRSRKGSLLADPGSGSIVVIILEVVATTVLVDPVYSL